VVWLHVGDDGNLGPIDEKRPVALIGFGHEDVTSAVVSVGAVPGELSSDGERRVDSTVLQCDHQHRRRRGLAVGASDRDPAAPLHHRCQSLRSVQHEEPARAGLSQLDVVLTDG